VPPTLRALCHAIALAAHTRFASTDAHVTALGVLVFDAVISRALERACADDGAGVTRSAAIVTCVLRRMANETLFDANDAVYQVAVVVDSRRRIVIVRVTATEHVVALA
jgi:hypothetical protein